MFFLRNLYCRTIFLRTSNYDSLSVFVRSFGTRRTVKKNGTVKLSLVGASVGALVGAGYYIQKSNKPTIHIINSEETIPVIKDVPAIKPSRKIHIPEDASGLKLTLYQYQTCPFCCKVRAFLDYYGISYNVIEVNPVLRDSIKWSQYKKVPILLAKTNDGYQQLNDSSMIISALSSYLMVPSQELNKIVKYYPVLKFNENNNVKSDILNKYFLMMEGNNDNRNTERIMEEQKWRQWVDNVLVHVLSPNVYRSKDEALQAFNWFSETGQWKEHFSNWERNLVIYVGAFAMWLLSKNLKKKYNLKEDVRQSLYDECEHWMKAIKKKGTPFMGGSTPDLSDLAVYGVLNSIEGCYAFRDLLENTSILPWYKAMKEAVNNHEGLKNM